jgi:hypothetical protein
VEARSRVGHNRHRSRLDLAAAQAVKRVGGHEDEPWWRQQLERGRGGKGSPAEEGRGGGRPAMVATATVGRRKEKPLRLRYHVGQC